jgi:hypothetical protein
MKRTLACILATVLLLGADARAQQDRPTPRPAMGSVSRQLMLKHRLRRIADGRLTAALGHNRDAWRGLSPEQRDAYRREAYAFLKKSDPQQRRLLMAYYENLAHLPAEKRAAYRKRARWLNVVIESFSDAERAELRRLPPGRRAERLIQRRDELIRAGKLTFDAQTRPATGPRK